MNCTESVHCLLLALLMLPTCAFHFQHVHSSVGGLCACACGFTRVLPLCRDTHVHWHTHGDREKTGERYGRRRRRKPPSALLRDRPSFHPPIPRAAPLRAVPPFYTTTAPGQKTVTKPPREAVCPGLHHHLHRPRHHRRLLPSRCWWVPDKHRGYKPGECACCYLRGLALPFTACRC